VQEYFLDLTAVTELGPQNAMRLLFHSRAFRPYIANWEAMAAEMIQWLHREVLNGAADEQTRHLLDELLSYPGVPRQWRTADLDAPTAPFLAIELRKADLTLRFFTTLTSFGTPHDVTLQELRIESFFPPMRRPKSPHSILVRKAYGRPCESRRKLHGDETRPALSLGP